MSYLFLSCLTEDSEGEGKEVAEAEVREAEAANPPDYKDRVVSTTSIDNRPSIGKVGQYIPERKAYEITFTFSDELEPNIHVDFCPQHWVEKTWPIPKLLLLGHKP